MNLLTADARTAGRQGSPGQSGVNLLRIIGSRRKVGQSLPKTEASGHTQHTFCFFFFWPYFIRPQLNCPNIQTSARSLVTLFTLWRRGLSCFGPV
jgi:hypothetical protein